MRRSMRRRKKAKPLFSPLGMLVVIMVLTVIGLFILRVI